MCYHLISCWRNCFEDALVHDWQACLCILALELDLTNCPVSSLICLDVNNYAASSCCLRPGSHCTRYSSPQRTVPSKAVSLKEPEVTSAGYFLMGARRSSNKPSDSADTARSLSSPLCPGSPSYRFRPKEPSTTPSITVLSDCSLGAPPFVLPFVPQLVGRCFMPRPRLWDVGCDPSLVK